MKVQIPKNLDFKKIAIRLPIFLLGGYFAYHVTGVALVGVAAFLFMFVFSAKIARYKINAEFSQHLNNFGSDFTSRLSDEFYESCLMGFIPFNGKSVVCTVFADESGIFLKKRRTKRHISWGTVIDHRSSTYLGHPVLELNLHNYEKVNRLVIPWSEKFNHFAP